MDDARAAAPRAALAAFAPVAALVLAALYALAWADVLPGGWTLRGLLEPHARAEHARLERARHEALLAFARENAVLPAGSVCFLGSSTVARFPLARCFPGAACVARGIPEEPAERLAQRVAQSLPPAPGGIVLVSGRIEHLRGDSPAQVARAVAGVLDALARAAPGAPVLVLGLLPEREPAPGVPERLRRTNAALASLAAERGARFLDPVRAPLAEGGPGAEHLAPSFSSDRWHLDEEGYRVLAERLLREGGAVARLLAPPPSR